MPAISQRVRLAIKSQLADPATGFNGRFTTALQTYNADPTGIHWTGINWSQGSRNFMYGRINPTKVDEGTGLIQYPFVTLDTLRAQHTNEVVSVTFAGPVTAVIDVHLGWDADGLLFDFASYGDALEDAMFATINNLAKQNYGANILYNGRMAVQRSEIYPGGPNWRQSFTFLPEFKVITI